MVFYYDQRKPMYFAILAFSRAFTVFGMVVRRIEFWLYASIHITGIILFRLDVFGVGEFGSFRWEAVTATQLFMVFSLTFFNQHCFARYLHLYDQCVEVLDGVLFFVQEMVVSFAFAKVEKHRIRAVKYVLAMLHIFFMGVTGNMKTKGDWIEVVKRGLLNRHEAEQLQAYPVRSAETVLVLATWAMQIVDKALEDDVFWFGRSMRIAHTHNRLQEHMTRILRAMHEIGDVLALPIPFPYFHVMNLVLVVNLLMLCVITASFSTYQTIFPFLVSLMFFMGLREISSSIADPFDGEECDFPIATFLQYALDTSICLLEAFRLGHPDEFVTRILDNTTEFSNDQLRHPLPPAVLYRRHYDPTTQSPFSWNKEMPLSIVAGSAKGSEHVLRTRQMVLPKHKRLKVKSDSKDDDDDDFKVEEDVEEDVHEKKYPICCFCCNRRKKRPAFFVTEEVKTATPDVMKWATAWENAKEETQKMEKEADNWKRRVEIQAENLGKLVGRARKLGHPVDELLGIKPAPERIDQKRRKKPDAQFENFADAAKLMKSSANVDKGMNWSNPGSRAPSQIGRAA